MIFQDKTKAKKYIDTLNGNIEVKNVKQTRTSLQNRALHLLFEMVSEGLNELGLEFHYTGLKGMDLTCRWTPNIVKEFLWKPIQIAKFDKESTTKLTTDEIDQILDVIIKFFGERDYPISFPSRFYIYEDFAKAR